MTFGIEMKKRYQKWLVGIGICAAPLLLVLWCYMTANNAVRDREAQRERITNADHVELLAACRSMAQNYRHFWDAWAQPSTAFGSDVMWDRKRKPLGEDVPAAIRNMNPDRIRVSPDRTYVALHPTLRVGFIGFVKGKDDSQLGNLGGSNITDGLWYVP